MNTNRNEAAVYVGTYAKYNNGSIKGAWLMLEDYSDKDEFLKACCELHKDETDPELMFQDYECFPDRYYGECSIDSDIWEVYFTIDEDLREAFEIFVDSGLGTDKDQFEEAYQGEFNSELDFTYGLVDDMGIIGKGDSTLERYFDYEKFSRDLFIGDYTFINGYVFGQY